MHATVGMSSPDSFSDPAGLPPQLRPRRVGAQCDPWALLYCGDASGQSCQRQLRTMCGLVARDLTAQCHACDATFDDAVFADARLLTGTCASPGCLNLIVVGERGVVWCGCSPPRRLGLVSPPWGRRKMTWSENNR
jgi:hypothetical protein